jgi:hypothetical protein
MNPFASRHIRPGARRFQFPPGQSAENLVAELARHNWWGQIVGPHGSGKSTLLATIQPVLDAAGRQAIVFALRADHVIAPQEPAHHHWDCETLVIVDGYEQLSWWQRFLLRSLCRRRKSGLLITTHVSQGLPTIWRTEATPELAWDLVQSLQRDAPHALITRDDVEKCFSQNPGDIRETFFALYDIYEERATKLLGPEYSD